MTFRKPKIMRWLVLECDLRLDKELKYFCEPLVWVNTILNTPYPFSKFVCVFFYRKSMISLALLWRKGSLVLQCICIINKSAILKVGSFCPLMFVFLALFLSADIMPYFFVPGQLKHYPCFLRLPMRRHIYSWIIWSVSGCRYVIFVFLVPCLFILH